MDPITLFSPGRIDGFATGNRIVMAPMTRSRASSEGVPSPLAIEYYRQRATAGLIVSEGTAPSASGLGYPRTPGLYNSEQAAAWRQITDAVHAAGGRIFLQIMHVGRIAHPANRTIADPPVAPSAIQAKGMMWTDAKGMQPFDTPRALETHEIPGVVAEFAECTRLAMDVAGFDGVELHAASGYLPMQFLSTGSNRRTDGYGGSARNRVRFVVECLEAMIAAAGSAGKVGIKISPAMPFNDIQDDETSETYAALAEAITPLGLAYLHVMRTPGVWEGIPSMRLLYSGTLIAGGGYTQDSANEALSSDLADFIAFGTLFVANPDLPARFATAAPLAVADQNLYYSPGPVGYIDYPAL